MTQLTYVTHFYFDGKNEAVLVDLLRKYASYSPAILQKIQFVLVDDASIEKVEIPADIDLNILLLRIRENIPWNQPGARNLGLTYARSDKVFVSDLDHDLREDTLAYILAMKDPRRTIYKLKRTTVSGEPIGPHPNTFVLSRAHFMKLFGYDEDFSGHYGFDDAMFWRWQRYHGTRFMYLPSAHRLYVRDLELTSSHTLERDLEHNRKVAEEKKMLWKKYGPAAGHSNQGLRFTWDIIEDRQMRIGPPATEPNKLWVKTWWWRWLWG